MKYCMFMINFYKFSVIFYDSRFQYNCSNEAWKFCLSFNVINKKFINCPSGCLMQMLTGGRYIIYRPRILISLTGDISPSLWPMKIVHFGCVSLKGEIYIYIFFVEDTITIPKLKNSKKTQEQIIHMKKTN